MAKKKSLVWLNCSEEQLSGKVKAWLKNDPLDNSILFLEGEMGAGKSTFVRLLLQILAPDARSQGSPTFPLVQEYETERGIPFYHIDLYRLKNEAELIDSGLEAQIEAPGAIACIEWGSLFATSFSYWLDSSKKRRKSVYLVTITEGDQPMTRSYKVESI